MLVPINELEFDPHRQTCVTGLNAMNTRSVQTSKLRFCGQMVHLSRTVRCNPTQASTHNVFVRAWSMLPPCVKSQCYHRCWTCLGNVHGSLEPAYGSTRLPDPCVCLPLCQYQSCHTCSSYMATAGAALCMLPSTFFLSKPALIGEPDLNSIFWQHVPHTLEDLFP